MAPYILNGDIPSVPDHKETFRQVRNYLAGRLVGATRDEALLHEVIKCLFSKFYLLRHHILIENPSDTLAVAKQFRQAFDEVKIFLPRSFDNDDEFLLDPVSIAYVNRMLDNAEIDSLKYDPFGDAYEVFIGNGIRGQEGQFFTPRNAVDLLVSIINPKPGETIIDPACGSGGFLGAAVRHLMYNGVTPEDAAASVFGVDKDSYLVGLASSRLSMATLTASNVFCADSLAWAAEQGDKLPIHEQMGTFDIVLTNPPFGARIISASAEVQASFELGYKWKRNAKTGEYQRLTQTQSSVPPQVLFMERCLTLVRPGGRVGMVVPESLLSNKGYRHVVSYLRTHAILQAVIGMPEALFKTSGKGGTHTKTCLLVFQKKESASSATTKIFMAEAQWCGNDSRGKRIEHDDLPKIAINYQAAQQGKIDGHDHLGYQVSQEQVYDDILAPRYYNPDVKGELETLRETHELVKISDLVAAGLLKITSGDEVGKLTYGGGVIPFVRTSDISNWEVKVNPKQCVSEEVYKRLATKQDVREGDILFVRDGTYLIGTCAYITKYDTQILYQSHICKLRITDPSIMSPYLLLVALSSEPVQLQIKAKRFTQDIIDTLGDRILELVLPIPKNIELRDRITRMVEKSIMERVEARELSRQACLDLIGYIRPISVQGNTRDESIPFQTSLFQPVDN